MPRRPRQSLAAELVAQLVIASLVLALLPPGAQAAAIPAVPGAGVSPRGRPLAVAKDDVGNRLSQTTTLGPAGSPGGPLTPGTLTYGYDTRDRLLTETLGTNPSTGYTYDPNGNLITKDAEATYTWDRENRLVRVEKTDGTVIENAYDADGNRIQTKTTPPGGPTTTVNFLVDTSGSLSHVVAETDASNTLKAYYLRGDDLLALMRPTGPTTWQTRYYHPDGIGSIRRLTDEAAIVTDAYTYAAFGQQLAHTGSDPQPYAFTGEPYDPNLGFQFHRARWMDPRGGRFLGMDPFDGLIMDPTSLHRYIYAHLDPISNADPTGRFTAGQTLTVLAIAVTLASLTYSLIGHLQSPGIPVNVDSEALIVEGSGWTTEDASAALVGAAQIWAHVASIFVRTSRIRTIPDDRRLRYVTRFNADAAALSVDGYARSRHVTVFVASTGLGSGGLATLGRGVNRAYAFISGGAPAPDSYIVAHEWGHTLLLDHKGPIDFLMGSQSPNPAASLESNLPFNLMNSLFIGETLSPGQRAQAREYGKSY